MAADIPDGATAVIFVSARAASDPGGYAVAAEAMADAAARFPGYPGVHSARGDDGIAITVSYWADDAAARAWKADVVAGRDLALDRLSGARLRRVRSPVPSRRPG